MKKIMFVILGLDYSGAEIVLDKYIYKNKNIDPYFLLIYKNENVENILIDKYGSNKVYYANFKHNKNKLRYIPFLESKKITKYIKEIIDKINIELIYCNNTLETMLVGLNAQKYNMPIIGHIHDMSYGIRSPIKRYFINKSIAKIDTSITVSKACCSSWKNIKNIVYNGVEDEYFSNEYKKNINNIGYVGALSYRKGFDIFVKFIDKVLTTYIDKKIYIAYSENSNNELITKLNELLNKYPNQIIVKKNLRKNDIASLYDEIDLLCVPSRNDPFPTVVLEGMARCCIVIGSNVDGLPELLDNDMSLLFNNKGINDIFSKFESILYLNDCKITELSKKLNYLCKEKFKNSDKIDKINSIINKIE